MGIRISTLQLFFMLFIVQTGTVFISFQTPLIREAGQDAWLVFLCLGLLHLPHLWLFDRFIDRFIWSKPICVLYGLYWFYICTTFAAKTAYTLNVWAFPETPVWLVLILMTFVVLTAVLGKAATPVNLGVVLIPLIVIFILFVSMSTNDLIWTNLLPVGSLSLAELQKATLPAQLPFIGIDLYLLLRLLNPKKVSFLNMAIYSGIWLVFFLYMLIFPLTYFSLKEFDLLADPIMYLLKSQQVTFVERLDLFFIYIWLAWSIITICIYAFAVLRLLSLLGVSYVKKHALWMATVYVFVSYMLVSKSALEWSAKGTPYMHILFAIVIPAIVIVSNKLRGRRDMREGPA